MRVSELRNQSIIRARWQKNGSPHKKYIDNLIDKTNWRGERFRDFAMNFIEDDVPDSIHFDFRGMTVTGANFKSADLSECAFEDCEFIDCSFSRCIASNAFFINCTFQRCEFTSISFRDIRFLNCSFKDTDFRHSVLSGVVFSGSSMDDCMFTSIEQFLIPLRDLRQMTGAYHLRGGRWLGSRFERGVTNSIARFIAAVDRAPFYREQSRFVEGYLLDEWLGNFGTSNHIYSSVISYFRRIGDKSGIDKVEYLIDRSNLFDNRKDLSGFLSSFFYSLYWGLLKFGRSTFRAVIISIAIIFAFSFGYWDSDIYTYSTLKAGVDGDMEITDRKLNFVEAVYFSSVTFATLGYGDISPNKDLIREGCLERWNFDGHPFESLCSTKLLMPVLEAGLGAMMIALIVVTIVKQASRHYG